MEANHTQSCPTIRIVRPDCPEPFVIINLDDFDPDEHTLYLDPATPDSDEHQLAAYLAEQAPATAQEAQGDAQTEGALQPPPGGIKVRRRG